MHMRDRGSAQVMRRASTGPHALMQRQAIAPYVPDRGMGFYRPSRSQRPSFGSLGAGAVVGQAVTGVKTGVTSATVATSIGAGVASAVGAGAAAGSVIPIIGTAIGAIVGLIASGVFSHRKDPEDYNFQQAMAIARSSGPQAVLDIGNKYLVLAGLFDLTPSQIKGNIPIYKKYGRMGEYKFVTDLCNLIYNAAQQGQIVPTDTPQSVFNRIVQPWINSFGFGTMTDSNAEMITMILLGMTAEYIAGLYTRWYAVGGQYPFGGLPPFALPNAVSPTASATPSPISVTPAYSTAPSNTPPTELQTYLAGGLPQLSASIGYAWDRSLGNFMALPAGGTYAGLSSSGQWIVHYTTGDYVLKNGVLTPYSAPRSVIAPPSAVVPTQDTSVSMGPGYVTAPTTDTTATPPVAAIPNMAPQIQYSSGGGGGSYAPLQPIVSAPVATAQTSNLLGGVSMQTLLLAGGAILALSLLLPHNMASVRSVHR